MISALLLILAGTAKAFMDISAHGKPFWFMSKNPIGIDHYLNKRYDWWYMDRSAGFKWKNGRDNTDGEKFFGSSGFLVFTQDLWHLAQFFFLNTMILAIVLYEPMINWWADFLIYGVVMKTTFEVMYSKILVKK